MRPPTIAVVFDRKHVAPEKAAPFELRVTFGGHVYYITTGIRSKKRNSLSVEESKRLAAMQVNVTDKINDCLIHNKPIIMDEIRRIAFKGSSETDFLEFFNERIEKRVMAEGTRAHYVVTINALEDFGRIKSMVDVTVENISEFDTWLHAKGLADPTVYKYHSCLKAVINDAVAFGKLEVNPYSRLRGKISRGDKQVIDYLSEEEFSRLMSAQMPSEFMEHARDLFVFQTMTALSYSDLVEFDINKFRHENGRYYRVDATRSKNGVKMVTELLKPAVEIGEKYDWKLPIMTNQKYNYALKLVAQAASIHRNLHTHMARSTFATWALSNGAKIQNVSRMLGHTNVSMTMKHYASIQEKDVIKDFDRLNKKFEKDE